MEKTTSFSLLEQIRFGINADNLSIRADQTRARIRLFPTMVLSQSVIEPLLVALLWNQVSHQYLLSWLAVLMLLHGAEMWSWWMYRADTSTIEQCKAWRIRFVGFALAVGAMWGIAVTCFFSTDLVYQALLICVILGLTSGAVAMNPVYPPALYSYMAVILLPAIIRVAYAGDVLHWIIALMLTLFTAVLLDSGRHLARTFYISLSQRYENISLVEQLTNEKSRAELASREKSRFLATASHDLRQPLQALMLFSDALQDVAQEQKTKKLSSQIGKSVKALVEMFDELLDVSRLEAGIVEAKWQNFELQPLLDRLYVDLLPLANSKGLDITIPCGDWVIYSDPFLLDRILRNLISNALRYTDQGSVVVDCITSAVGLRFVVSDTGIGISPEAMPHIFEEYFQVDNQHRDRRKGLGLGLAIVRRVENLLGCRVEVESTPGVGSEFSFYAQLGNRDEQLAQPFVVTLSRYDMRGVSVALVEDDADIRQMLASLMQDWGCRVFEGEYAEDVISKLDMAGKRPDILVCDYRLPQGMTAVHVIKRFRELWGDGVPALILTGDTAADVLQKIHSSGAMLLHKPIAPIRLRAMMYLSLHGEG
jgi:signal transduction histidine kinase/CheY-like chemotaxis protein